MEAYEYVLQFLIAIGWLGLIVVVGFALYVGGAELYDAIRQNRMTWSHIKVAFFMAADYVIYKVTRAKNAGRHAVKVKKDDVNLITFWAQITDEFEALPHSLSRVNSVHA